MLVARQSRTWAGNSCKECGNAIFKKATLHTLFLGWWGVISMILTPIFILSNLANVSKTRGLKSLPASSNIES